MATSVLNGHFINQREPHMNINKSALKMSVQMLILPVTGLATGGNLLAAEQTL
jgi:hypothetical protein